MPRQLRDDSCQDIVFLNGEITAICSGGEIKSAFCFRHVISSILNNYISCQLSKEDSYTDSVPKLPDKGMEISIGGHPGKGKKKALFMNKHFCLWQK